MPAGVSQGTCLSPLQQLTWTESSSASPTWMHLRGQASHTAQPQLLVCLLSLPTAFMLTIDSHSLLLVQPGTSLSEQYIGPHTRHKRISSLCTLSIWAMPLLPFHVLARTCFDLFRQHVRGVSETRMPVSVCAPCVHFFRYQGCHPSNGGG